MGEVFIIIASWMIVPFIAFGLAFIVGKGVIRVEKKYEKEIEGKWKKRLAWLLIGAGCFEAFSAGMNNVANSVGPLVGAGLLSVSSGTFYGGLFVALGAVLFGGRVVETNGKKITDLSMLQGSSVSATGGILVVIASLLGIPVPLTQVTTSGILGIGASKKGFSVWKKSIVHKMLKVWIVSPVLSLVISYSFIKLLIDFDMYTVIILVCVFVSTVGTISLAETIKKEQQSTFEHGEGI